MTKRKQKERLFVDCYEKIEGGVKMEASTIISSGKVYHAFQFERGDRIIIDGIQYLVVYAKFGKAFQKQ